MLIKNVKLENRFERGGFYSRNFLNLKTYMNLNLNTATAEHTFTLWPIDTKFNRIAGIYIFLIIPPITEIPSVEAPELMVETPNAVVETLEPEAEALEAPYSLLYAGITNNFRGRFNQHHKIEQAKALGMTNIGILKIISGRKRKKIEREILKHLNPPLNQTWLSPAVAQLVEVLYRWLRFSKRWLRRSK